MRTIICHFYNEEYLLNWWLPHHKKLFDHGIMIDYQSTDQSVDLIRSHCPSWEIINSRNSSFGAAEVDREVMDIEQSVKGWKIAVNVTEFLIGDFSILNDTDPNQQIFIPTLCIVDSLDSRDHVDTSIPLFHQVTTSIDLKKSFTEMGMRSIHNYNVNYDFTGRHFFQPLKRVDEYPLLIVKYVFAPMTQEFIKRKLQIQYRIPITDIVYGYGHQHTDCRNPNGLTEKRLIERKNENKDLVDASPIISYYLKLSGLN